MTDPKDKDLATSEDVSPFFESEAKPSSQRGSTDNRKEQEQASPPRPDTNLSSAPGDNTAPGEVGTQLEIPSPLIPASPKNVSGATAQSAHPSDSPTQFEMATPLQGSGSGSPSESPTQLDVNLGSFNVVSRPTSGIGQLPTF